MHTKEPQNIAPEIVVSYMRIIKGEVYKEELT